MRVLVVKPDSSIPGGVANYYSVLSEYLEKDADYFIVGSRTGEHGFIATCTRVVRDTIGFWRTLKRSKYHLVHLNPSLHDKAVLRDGALLLLAYSRGVKSLVLFHGWVDNTERRVRRWYLGLFRWTYFRADAMIVLASMFKSKLEEMGYHGPIYIETTFVSDKIFQYDALKKGNLGGVNPTTRFNVLSLSRMVRGKGVEETLEAHRILKAKYPGITLTIAGDGPELQRSKQRARQLGLADVEFPGYVVGEAKRRIFEAADVYCFPTKYGEGMPTSVLEAMAHGLPVVTRPVGGLRDFFQDGRMGFLTESLEPRVIAELIERLFLDPALCARIAAHNRQYAYDHFRASQAADRLRNIYHGLTSEAMPQS